MKFTKSWLLIAILVGVLSKNVFSFPAHRALDLGNELVSEDTDADEADDDDASDSKKADIAKEGSGDTAKKTSVESKEDSSPEESSSEEDDKEDATKDKKEEAAPEADKKSDTKDESKKKADLPKPDKEVKKRNGCCCECECPEEECCHHHHEHEHEGCCHEGCCCGHENEHEHGHHEHEDCCHHHGHHHGFCHEWGQECCGEHHGHECCGHHEHGHHHEGDHEHCHEHCHGCCEHHEEEEPECCCCCGGGKRSGRSDVPLGYHCHDMVSKEGNSKTKRFCVPVYENPNTARSRIETPSVVKKQTVHVGYGYASGDNYRLGYQEGGMGGLASSFTGQVGADHGGNFDASDHFNKKRSIEKRHFEGGHGYGSFNSGMMHGSATPYGHPVTHPGFTTMGFPGHALASQDVRNTITHPKVRRQAFGQESQEQAMMQQQLAQMGQMGQMGQMEMGALPQMEQPQGGFPGMMSQPAESDPMQAMGMQPEEMQGSMKSMMSRFSNDQSMASFQQPGQYGNAAQFVGGMYFTDYK